MHTNRVVVVGGGPSGIVCSLELIKRGLQVVLIEGGLTNRPRSTQNSVVELDDIDRLQHMNMSVVTARQLGGTSGLWGGRCVPFDPIDFLKRDFVPNSGWPINYEHIAPFLHTACEYADCGRPVFSTHRLTCEQTTILPVGDDTMVRSTSLERWSLPTHFGRKYKRQITGDSRVEFLSGLTVTEIDVDPETGCVNCVTALSNRGDQISVTGAAYVVACGGIETTRLLLQPSSAYPEGLGNTGNWLGRCYMSHVSGQIAEAQFSTDPQHTQIQFLRDLDGTYCRQRWNLSDNALMEHSIANIAMWLVNPRVGNPQHKDGLLSLIWLMLRSPIGPLLTSESMRQSALIDAPKQAWRKHLGNVLRTLPRTMWQAALLGWNRATAKRKAPGYYRLSKKNRYPIQFIAEQIPQSTNCITLSDRTDRWGMRRAHIHLELAAQDVDSVLRAHDVLDESLRARNVGRLQYFSGDLREQIKTQTVGGYHQMGTTRMGNSPRHGVVDRNCRVFGTTNLYVASSSIFCTSGHAHSTLMTLAFAARLAEHIASQYSEEQAHIQSTRS